MDGREEEGDREWWLGRRSRLRREGERTMQMAKKWSERGKKGTDWVVKGTMVHARVAGMKKIKLAVVTWSVGWMS